MARGLINQDTRLYWNIDAHVGPGCPNKADDVQLVQFGYWCMGNNPKTPIGAADRALFSAIVPGAPYSGLASDPLTIAIKRHQQIRGGTQDGKVSPMQANQGYNWIISALSNNISNYLPSMWPQIDKHTKCPPALKAAILKCFAPHPG
jgi:hypothetical protein